MDKYQLAEIFPLIWCRESSAFPSLWTPEYPAIGQSLQTAKLARYFLGGNILLMVVSKDPCLLNFVNFTQTGEEIDFAETSLTRGLFPVHTQVMNTVDLLALGVAYPDIDRRYLILVDRFEKETGVMVP